MLFRLAGPLIYLLASVRQVSDPRVVRAVPERTAKYSSREAGSHPHRTAGAGAAGQQQLPEWLGTHSKSKCLFEKHLQGESTELSAWLVITERRLKLKLEGPC